MTAGRFLRFGLLSLATVLDVQAVQALIGEGLLPRAPGLEGFAWHTLSVGCAILGFFRWYPESYQKARLTLVALVVGFCLPVPVIGLGLLIVYRRLLESFRVRDWEAKYYFGERQILTEMELEGAPAGTTRSVLDTLRGRETEARRQAILALRGLDPKKSLPLLQKAIQDGDEQVRLLSQTQFSQIMARLETSIKRLEAELVEGERTPERLHCLAEQYHELVYLGLSSEETDSLYLGRALELLREAQPMAPTNLNIGLLALRCCVRVGDLAQARRTLETLRGAGCRPATLAAWEAEILFLERDWSGLFGVLSGLRAQRMVAAHMRKLCDFWLGPLPRPAVAGPAALSGT